MGEKFKSPESVLKLSHNNWYQARVEAGAGLTGAAWGGMTWGMLVNLFGITNPLFLSVMAGASVLGGYKFFKSQEK